MLGGGGGKEFISIVLAYSCRLRSASGGNVG
jgi:hypothetical protein